MKLINKEYVNDKLKYRSGNCNKCGKCCGPCPYFKNNNCIVYNNRPWWCHKEFPIDQFDFTAFDIKDGDCGFYFDK